MQHKNELRYRKSDGHVFVFRWDTGDTLNLCKRIVGLGMSQRTAFSLLDSRVVIDAITSPISYDIDERDFAKMGGTDAG